MRYGVAGLMGAGKSTAALFLCRRFSWDYIDADTEAKRVMESDEVILSQLSEAFGVVKDGRIDYAKLGQRVFGSYDALLELNNVVHPPLVLHLLSLQKRGADRGKDTLIDGALLPLWEGANLLDRGLWVDAPRPLRTTRLVERTGLGASVIEERIARQNQLLKTPTSPLWSTLCNENSPAMFERSLERWGILHE